MEVSYKSTRGGITGLSFQEALLTGFAPDGGLFVPDSLPKFSSDDLKKFSNFTYPQLIEKFARMFIPQSEISDLEISRMFSLKSYKINYLS